MTRLFLIRHGSNDFLGKGLAGRQPIPLNELGHREAAVIPHFLAGEELHLLYTSPIRRCQETAAPLAAARGMTPELAPELQEVDFGDWTNASMDSLEADPRWDHWNRHRHLSRVPNGESMLEVQSRLIPFLLGLHEKHRGKSIALFSHGDPIRVALLYFLGMPVDNIRRLDVAPASISQVHLTEGPAVVWSVNERPIIDVAKDA